jgi:hypothetical protein
LLPFGNKREHFFEILLASRGEVATMDNMNKENQSQIRNQHALFMQNRLTTGEHRPRQ